MATVQRADGASTSASFTTRPLHPSLGAEVIGLDVSQPLAPSTLAALKDVWRARHILLFRGQTLSDAQQIAFSKNFGTLDVHIEDDKTSTRQREILRVANVDDEGNTMDPSDPRYRYYSILTSVWHTDGSYRVVPSFASNLYALEVPAEGGNTCFADCVAAYTALPAPTKARIAGKHMVHSYANTRYFARELPPLSPDQLAALPPATHPIVRTHADGRKSLYISANVARNVGGMPVEEGEALLRELLAFVEQPQFVYCHQWKVGDLLMWDNRGTLHRVTPWDAGKYRRHLRRTEIKGTEIPV